MSVLTLVVAVADNGVIGKDGALPWRIPEDMRRFRALTMGKPCIMGRRTWDSLPRKPLTGRLNIVVSRESKFAAPGAVAAMSLDDAIAKAGDAEEICLIGGASLYREALPRAHRIHLTEVHQTFEGDTHMPPIDRSQWRETVRENFETALRYSFVTLSRV